jgi:DNA-binding response OmpR family regulator
VFLLEDPVAKKKIFLVDDDRQILRMIRKFLISKQYDVKTAQNGREAITKILEDKPDLVITDLEMPEVNGLTFTAALKKHSTVKDIPVIVLTAHAGFSNQKGSFKAGADVFLKKPVKMKVLETNIKFLLRSTP